MSNVEQQEKCALHDETCEKLHCESCEVEVEAYAVCKSCGASLCARCVNEECDGTEDASKVVDEERSV